MSIRTLGKQSLIYGIGTILTRVVTFLLLPLYTNVFTTEEYGIVSLAYAFTGFIMIAYRYGMDSALMKYYIDAKREDKKTYFTTIFSIQTLTSLIFSLFLFLTAGFFAPIFLGGAYTRLMQLVTIILFLDALWMLPMLILRADEKPRQYILFSLLNVILLMGFNIYFVVIKGMGITGVLIGNIIASGTLLFATVPIVVKNFSLKRISRSALQEVLKFGLPFFPAGIFTMVMELSDRYLLEWLADTSTVGLYSAGNKLGMFGLLLVMGFNMGWTPYFLKKGKDADAPQIFARISTYFLGLVGYLIVLISLWIDQLVQFRIGNATLFGQEFWSSTQVVPIILLGYYFFGLYVLQLPGVFMTKQTKWVPLFRGIGATLTILVNILLIPIFGIIGAASAKAFAFFGMSLAIMLYNQKHYPIPYFWSGILFPIIYLLITIIVPMGLSVNIFFTILYPILWVALIADSNDRKRLIGLVK
ncbi:MAG: oligosaccharide flippase family protein [Planctomycetia bacterium]|nr:oligosaccharide flippase family protein [Planctomycetia bacterium]